MCSDSLLHYNCNIQPSAMPSERGGNNQTARRWHDNHAWTRLSTTHLGSNTDTSTHNILLSHPCVSVLPHHMSIRSHHRAANVAAAKASSAAAGNNVRADVTSTTSSVARRPRAVAVVLGHLGATHAQLDALSDLYVRRGCWVVAARCPPVSFFMAQHGWLRPVAAQVVAETATLVRRDAAEVKVLSTTSTTTEADEDAPALPVVVHLFSNGGAFLLEELGRGGCSQEEEEEDHPPRRPDNDDWALFRRHVRHGYLFYDSCPCYLHVPWRLFGGGGDGNEAAAAAASSFWRDAFPFPGWTPWARKLYLAAASACLGMWCLLTGSTSRPRDFWNAMSRPPLDVAHLVYFYTTDDKVTDASRIDALVEEQKKRRLMQRGTSDDAPHVTVHRHEDSGHVRLCWDHPDEYGRAIDRALEGAIDRAGGDGGTGKGPHHHER